MNILQRTVKKLQAARETAASPRPQPKSGALSLHDNTNCPECHRRMADVTTNGLPAKACLAGCRIALPAVAKESAK